MQDIRWLDIPAGDREVSKHPAALFIDMKQHSRFRVLQVMFEDGVWCDVPIVEFVRANVLGNRLAAPDAAKEGETE